MSAARNRLLSELKSLHKLNWLRIEDPDDNLFVWRVALVVVNPDSDFVGGYFAGELHFSPEYPYKPPSFRFTAPLLFHPNVYPNGAICISILHSPGDDAMSGEQAGERWSPLQGVESVMLSILLLLDNPEINSPANVDASVLYRDDRAAYRARAQHAVARSQRQIPAGFVMPTTFDDGEANNKPGRDVEEDDAFWVESDEEELDFGSDDSDDEQEEEEEEDEEDNDKDDDEKAHAQGKP